MNAKCHNTFGSYYCECMEGKFVYTIIDIFSFDGIQILMKEFRCEFKLLMN